MGWDVRIWSKGLWGGQLLVKNLNQCYWSGISCDFLYILKMQILVKWQAFLHFKCKILLVSHFVAERWAIGVFLCKTLHIHMLQTKKLLPTHSLFLFLVVTDLDTELKSSPQWNQMWNSQWKMICSMWSEGSFNLDYLIVPGARINSLWEKRDIQLWFSHEVYDIASHIS